MIGPIEIRPGLSKHSEDIARVIRSGLDESFFNLTIYDCQGIDKFIRLRIGSRPFCDTAYTVAYADGRVVGVVELRLFLNQLFLNYISVLPQFRSQGIGRHLLKSAVQSVGQGRYQCMCLDVREHNLIAKSWYERLGFRSQRSVYWWEIPLPTVKGSAVATVSGYPQAQVVHEEFGFSQFDLITPKDNYTVGRLGDHLFRLTAASALVDSAVLPTLKTLDSRRRLLAIIGENQLPASLQNDAQLRGISSRMSVPLEIAIENLQSGMQHR